MQIHQYRQEDRDAHIYCNILHWIGNRVLPLSDDVTQHHSRTITGYPTPCTGPIAVLRNEDDVDSKEYQTACQREPGTIDGLVDKFIPERQVKVDTHHDFSYHDDRYYT